MAAVDGRKVADGRMQTAGSAFDRVTGEWGGRRTRSCWEVGGALRRGAPLDMFCCTGGAAPSCCRRSGVAKVSAFGGPRVG